MEKGISSYSLPVLYQQLDNSSLNMNEEMEILSKEEGPTEPIIVDYEISEYENEFDPIPQELHAKTRKSQPFLA